MATQTMSRLRSAIGGPGSATERSEGRVAHMIEEQTAKLPSDLFLWSALGAIGISLGLALTNRAQAANFVGQWVPTLLILGLYNKIVKVAGHDQQSS